MSEVTWNDVAEVLVRRWPAGPSSRGWEREQVAGFIAELQEDRLAPHWALKGLRASDSDFVPSVGGVTRRAREAKGPPTSDEIYEAEQLFRKRQEAQQLEISARQISA